VFDLKAEAFGLHLHISFKNGVTGNGTYDMSITWLVKWGQSQDRHGTKPPTLFLQHKPGPTSQLQKREKTLPGQDTQMIKDLPQIIVER
jgi:hypothetical protein